MTLHSRGHRVFLCPTYNTADAGDIGFLEAGFNITDRQVIAMNFSFGRFNYYDIRYSNLNRPGNSSINSHGYYHIYSLLYKYEIWRNKKLSVIAGSGIGYLRETLEYPYRFEENNVYGLKETKFSRVAVPFRLPL